MAFTYYWHDYETSGAIPRVDRPLQFAGQRTDADLNQVGEPLMVYCQPTDDVLPHPEASLITGITPQQALAEGLSEWQFIEQIHQELSAPGTCGVGYNTIRFDDEVTRYTLWRNFFDPYAREWRDGNSRWDLIDVVRLCHALRPDDINWPRRDDGSPSFRLEDLAKANALEQARAHDALSDVHATIALARLLKERKPRLYDYALKLRDKREAMALIDLARHTPLVHVSGRVAAELGCLTLWMPLIVDPVNRNAVLGYDLRHDPAVLFELDPNEIHERVFTPAEAMPDGVERIALKGVQVNRSPMLASTDLLDEKAAERCQLDLNACRANFKTLRDGLPELLPKLAEFQQIGKHDSASDPEQALYDGFVGNDDRRRADRVRGMDADELARNPAPFDDPRLNELLFRFRARHFPESLDADEAEEWQTFRRRKLEFAPDGGLSLDEYEQLLAGHAQRSDLNEEQRRVLTALDDWGKRLRASL